MRFLYYYYNHGCLIFRYSDDDTGERFTEKFLFYSLRGALQRFRENHSLQRKHIKVAPLYENQTKEN